MGLQGKAFDPDQARDEHGQWAAVTAGAAAAEDYAQNGTRSQAFKSWFGDWEHDPDNASKVVDDSGEPEETTPLLVHHGSSEEFDTFQEGDSPGIVGYFTSSEDYAQRYGGNIKSYYLNARNPLDLSDYTRMTYSDWIGTLEDSGVDTSEIDIDADGDPDDKGSVLYWELFDAKEGLAGTGSNLIEQLKRQGFDAVIGNEGRARGYAMFNSAQIKSVDNAGTFDPTDNRIKKGLKMGQEPRRYLIDPVAASANLPDLFIDLANWTKQLAGACKPVVELLMDQAARELLARVGASADVFSVVNPYLSQAVDSLTLSFCEATNKTTSRQLSTALADVREELRAGLLEGDALPELTRRVNGIFDHAEKWRAKRIAATEASRAVHRSELIAAEKSGVVKGKKWLLSDDACSQCQEIAARHPGPIPLDASFGTSTSKRPEYRDIQAAPAHPECNCSVTFELDESALQPGVLGTTLR